MTEFKREGEAIVRNSLLRNYAFLIGSYIVTRFLTFLSIVYLARVLGVEPFGRISLAQALLIHLTVFTHLGLTTFGTRELARDRQRIEERVSRILSLRLVLAVPSFLLLAVFGWAFIHTAELLVLVVLFGLTLFPTAFLLDWVFKGVERMEFNAVIEIIRHVPYVLLLLWLVRDPSDIRRVPVCLFIGTSLAALVSGRIFVRHYRQHGMSFGLSSWGNELRRALPFGLLTMALGIYHFADTIIVWFLEGERAVGWYSAAYKIVFFLLGVGGLYFEALFPSVSRSYVDAKERLSTLVNSSTERTSVLVIPLATGGILLAQPLIRFLYGVEYSRSIVVFQLLMCWMAIRLIGWNYGYCLMACDREKSYTRAVWCGSGLNVVFNLVLIPVLGIVGAAVAKVIGELAIFGYSCFQSTRVVHVQLLRCLWRPALASTIMGVCLVLLKQEIVTSVIVGTIVYCAAFCLIAWIEGASLREFGRRFISTE